MRAEIRELLRRIGAYLLQRALEPSTWRGALLMASVAGWAIVGSPSEADRGEMVIQIGLFLAGMIQAAVPQRTLYGPDPRLGQEKHE